MRVVDTRVDDADGDGCVRNRNGSSVSGAHRLSTPVDDLLGRIGLGRALAAQGSRATRLGAGLGPRLASGVRGVRVPGLWSRLRVGSGLTLTLGHGGDARRTHRMHRNTSLRQGLGQVRRERGRLALGEERSDLRVRGQGDAPRGSDQRGRAHEIFGAGLRAQVNRVVHQAGARAGRSDEAGVVVGPGGWGGRCGHAHGQGEGSDEPDACNIAAHGSSTFGCGSGEYGDVLIRTIML